MSQRRLTLLVFAAMVGFAALILSVGLVGQQAAQNVVESERRGEKLRLEAVRAGCVRAAQRDVEAYETNSNLRTFAEDAAEARRASGDRAIARKYDAVVVRAEERMKSIHARLPDSDEPEVVLGHCARLFPAVNLP